MPELSNRDKAFLRKAQRTPKWFAIIAGVFIVIPLVSWLLLPVWGPQINKRLDAMSTPLSEQLQAANVSLRTLKPTTPLEQKLVNTLQQCHKLAGGLSRASWYEVIYILLGFSLLDMFAFGLCCAAEAWQHHRYLRIIDALLKNAHSGSGT